MNEYLRWVLKIDWELVTTHPTEEQQSFPSIWSPYFIEEWKCKRTGEIKWKMIF